MKNLCTSLKSHAKNIIDFEKKKMLTLTKEELKSHWGAKLCYICGKRFIKKFADDNNYQKVKNHCHYTSKYRGAAHSIWNLKFNVHNKIPVVFHNGSIYDYYFIIKELAYEFERKFECLGENIEKYKNFSVQIQKEITNIDKDDNESVVTIPYKINFIDSARFTASLLSNLVDNLAKGIQKIKCKDCDGLLKYESVNYNLIKHKWLPWNKNSSNKTDEEQKKRSKNTFNLLIMILINLFSRWEKVLLLMIAYWLRKV